MKRQTILIILCFSFFSAQAQFEQKLSATWSTGLFKTFGKEMGQYDPFQMPNYKTGYTFTGAILYHVTPRFSLALQAAFQHTSNWYYDGGGEYNYLHYWVTDSSGAMLTEGSNALDLTNLSIGLIPRVYLFSFYKWKPFIYAGFSWNSTTASFRNSEWFARHELGVLPPDDTNPYNPWLEKNKGLGVCSGLGLEYFPLPRLGFTCMAEYQFIGLKKNQFKSESLVENFHAISLIIGVRLVLVRSKEL